MFKILETSWLVIACSAFAICVYFIITGSRQDAVYFLVFGLVSGLTFAVRRRQRIKFEASQKNKDQKKSI